MKRKATYVKNGITVDVVRSNSEACLILELKINGIPAYLFDFGLMKDLDPQNAPPCGCGDRSFVPCYIPAALLNKYGIEESQREDLIDLLVRNLHIGYCKRCR